MAPKPPPPDINDPSIPDDEWLYFRVYPGRDSLQRTDTGEYRPPSGEMKKPGPFSVDLGSLSTPEQTRDRFPNVPYHIARFTAGTAREYGCRVVRDPILDANPFDGPANPAHALVFGDHERTKGALAYDRQGKKIAYRSRIILINKNASHLPDDV